MHLCIFCLFFAVLRYSVFFPLYKYTSGVFTLVLTDAGKHHKLAERIYIVGA